MESKVLIAKRKAKTYSEANHLTMKLKLKLNNESTGY